MLKIMITTLITVMLASSCDYIRRKNMAPEYNPYSVLSSGATSDQSQMIDRAISQSNCDRGRNGRVMTFKLNTETSASTNYVNAWVAIPGISNNFQEVYVGTNKYGDVVAVGRIRSENSESLYATIFLCNGPEGFDSDRSRITNDVFITNMYTAPTVGLYHTSNSCAFQGLSANIYLCLFTTALNMNNTPPCPPGHDKINIRVNPICR